MALSAQSCVPCQGGIAPMDRDQAEQMLEQVPGWQLSEDASRIRRRFRLGDFARATAFVNRVAEIADAEDHHPDITFGYGYAEVEVHTHKIGGLHENDFILAAKINEAAEGA
ncbi:4a-hydroxytetrahydrobiopterin dehydratase [Halorhodospira neutriphila]|uniref:Putative pterin-4-alpha-carbinolamine dehydratase n=1 Tax=Halorhodospira neutriphila TaxID=168379 RepID=A0ABS1ECG3_9GAMM|nr:4a-hydroxytetrahydrobiopterin dehydratase [Halorhodospira neutriphila]MBK1727646.1 4a-hydroxytetrahydrobiopterin dehydratase [Halorhodospira neutriphila]